MEGQGGGGGDTVVHQLGYKSVLRVSKIRRLIRAADSITPDVTKHDVNTVHSTMES